MSHGVFLLIQSFTFICGCPPFFRFQYLNSSILLTYPLNCFFFPMFSFSTLFWFHCVLTSSMCAEIVLISFIDYSNRHLISLDLSHTNYSVLSCVQHSPSWWGPRVVAMPSLLPTLPTSSSIGERCHSTGCVSWSSSHLWARILECLPI